MQGLKVSGWTGFGTGLGLAIGVIAGAIGASGEAHAELVMVANYQPAPRKAPFRRVNEELVCTQEVKSCPGGGYVGRDPANQCRFKPCPTTTALN